MRVGLVLGAGGVVGQAYHAGVLAALEHDLGWDPRESEVIVGTSAGSITGTLLRRGVPASDLAAWTVRAPLTDEGRVLRDLFGDEHPELAPFRALQLLLRVPRVPGPRMLMHAVRHPREFQPLTAAMALLAPGRFDIVEQLATLAEGAGAWPEQELLISAVDRSTGRRVVFGPGGAADAPLHLAVSASCAVPGYFRPVTVAGRDYVDGGAHSPTSVDLLVGRELDLVIVISPMSGPATIPTDLYAASRRRSARLASREVAQLRNEGTPVVVFRPGPVEQEVMGNDLLSASRVADIVREAFLAAGSQAANTDLPLLLGRRALAS